MVLCAHQCGCG